MNQSQKQTSARPNSQTVQFDYITEPFWAESERQIPVALREPLRKYFQSCDEPWLIFPFAGISSDPFHAYAMRDRDGCLETLIVDEREGIAALSFLPEDCLFMELLQFLLLGELSICLRSGVRFQVRFHLFGEQNVLRLLQNFCQEAFLQIMPSTLLDDTTVLRFPRKFLPLLQRIEISCENIEALVCCRPDNEYGAFAIPFRHSEPSPLVGIVLTTRRILILREEFQGSYTPYANCVAMIPYSSVDGINIIQERAAISSVCVTCARGKEIKYPFPRKLNTELGALVRLANEFIEGSKNEIANIQF